MLKESSLLLNWQTAWTILFAPCARKLSMKKKFRFAVGVVMARSFIAPSLPISTQYEALKLLSHYEGLVYSGHQNGSAVYAHSSYSFTSYYQPLDVSRIISSLQQGRKIFADLLETGVKEIHVPKDIAFHPLSHRFCISVVTPPKRREFTRHGEMFKVTRDKLLVTDVLGAFGKSITEFEAGTRAVFHQMRHTAAVAVL